jgi:hypothetical protein
MARLGLMSVALVAFGLAACSDNGPSPFPMASARFYGRITSSRITGPPFRLNLKTYVNEDCISGFSAENLGQSDMSGSYHLLLVGTQQPGSACLRATVFPLSGVDSAVVLVRGVRMTEGGSPADSQRVDLVVP